MQEKSRGDIILMFPNIMNQLERECVREQQLSKYVCQCIFSTVGNTEPGCMGNRSISLHCSTFFSPEE